MKSKWFWTLLRKSARKRKGFTLVEVLVVVVILGLLAAISVPRVLEYLDQANRTAAKVQIQQITQALDLYRLNNGTYPTTEQGLEALVRKPTISPVPRNYLPGGYLKQLPLDPWKNPYLYRCPGERGDFDIVSFGSDGEEGGEGRARDINNHDPD